jgi:hypothetical protein
LIIARKRPAARPAGAEGCEERHRPIRALLWQLFGGFVMVVVTLALATAAHMTLKADADDLRGVASRTRALEAYLAEIRGDLAEVKADCRHMREDLAHVRKLLDEERER